MGKEITVENSDVPPEKPKKRPGRPKGRKSGTNVAKIVDLHARGVPPSDIAKTLGLARQSVDATLARWLPRLPNLRDVEAYRSVRADILSSCHETVIKSAMDPAKLDQARVGELAKLLHTVHQQERLERGLSTSNRAEIRYTKIEIPPD
jgi:uncharacterized protein (DUF433 family)